MLEQGGSGSFTPGDAQFLDDLDQKMEKQRKNERSFWVMWEELEPGAKEMIIDTARTWIKDGGTGLPNSDLNMEFYKRLVRQWDNGETDRT